MGWINQAKEEQAGKDAQHALDAGRKVFVYQAISAMTNSAASGPMTGMNDQIEAIEAVGWKLDSMSVGQSATMTSGLGMKSDAKGRMALIMIFRR